MASAKLLSFLPLQVLSKARHHAALILHADSSAAELQLLGDPFDLTSMDAEPDTSGRGQHSVSPGRLSRHELRRQRLLERRQQHAAGEEGCMVALSLM